LLLKPDVIARAVKLAERDGADHVVVYPGMDLKKRRPGRFSFCF